MPEGNLQSGGMSLEQEIARIEQDLASKRAALEAEKQSGAISEVPHEKETLREVVREQFGASSVAPQPTQPVTDANQQPVTPPPTVHIPSYLSDELKAKVQDLVNIAFSQTIAAAVKQAQATNNAALIDAFHDALVDELYNQLLERGKLKKL